MTRLIAVLTKQVQVQELASCIHHFKVHEAVVHATTDRGRIDLDDLCGLLAEVCPQTRVQLRSIEITDNDRLRRMLAADADIFVLPLYHNSLFFRAAPTLRRRARVVHITDGFGDLFSMWELKRAVLARTTAAMAKGALTLPFLYRGRADLEFNQFHPRKSPYARRSLPCGPMPLRATKRAALEELRDLRHPGCLIIDGFDLQAPAIAAALEIEHYVATQRDGGLLLDGERLRTNWVICAEELLEVMRPQVVVGVPSTALAAARWRYPDLPVCCLLTPAALDVRGPRFNAVFRKHGTAFGLTFAADAALDRQYAAFRALGLRDLSTSRGDATAPTENRTAVNFL